MTSSFKYKIAPRSGVVEVTIRQAFVATLVKACLWTGVSLAVACVLWRYAGRNGIAMAGIAVLLLSAAVAAVAANHSVTCSKISLSHLDIRLFTRNLFTFHRRSYPISQVQRFGFARYSHSLKTVLKFEIGEKWIILARRVNKEDVAKLLDEIGKNGIVLPK